MAAQFDHKTLSFVLRIWQEAPDDAGEPLWRGQIERVGSGEKGHFADAAGLLKIVSRWTPGFLDDSRTQEEDPS